MLPSMPILFTRDSQDAFGNKIEASTSFFHQNLGSKTTVTAEPPDTRHPVEPCRVATKETKSKINSKKKESPPEVNTEALESALIKSYYTKVQSRFNSNTSLPSNKFDKFRDILRLFDPSKETVMDLYSKIEALFGEEHKDLVEEFLLFLEPGQAAKVGRFMDHFMLFQLTGFIKLLQITLSRKPTVLRKVLRTLTSGINGGSVAEMKAKVYPHLRSNPKLWKMLLSLIPDERPPDSLYETGVDMLPDDFLTCDKGYEVWEWEDTDHNSKKLENSDETLNTMYMNGRVFLQRGRILRNASVTYPYSKEPYRVHARRLAPEHCHPSPPDSDSEISSPKKNNRNNPKAPTKRTRKQNKSPTKNSKDVNDNTKKEPVTNVTNSPRAVKPKQNNAKPKAKEKIETKGEQNKKEKKPDSRNLNITNKKDENAKLKQVKMHEESPKAKHVKFNLIPKVETQVSEKKNSVEVLKNSDWTREEDKTMLQVLKGEAGSEKVFGKIMELLPHRSAHEIKERFCHVMNLLQQMGVGEVT